MGKRTRERNEDLRRIRNGHRRKIAYFGLMFVGGLGIMLFSLRNMEQKQGSFLNLERDYISAKSKNMERWWLETFSATTDQREISGIVAAKEAEIRAAIKKYKDVSPLAREIATNFSSFTVSVFLGGMKSITVGSPSEIKNRPEICFIPRQLSRNTAIPFVLYWRSDWGLMMRAVDFPEPLFAAFLFHELGHGLRHPVNPTTKYNEPGSTAYVEEEVEMHELEFLVLDRASGGAFSREVKRIVDTHKAATVRDLMFILTQADLTSLEKSVHAESAGEQAAGMMYANFVLSVGFEWIDRKGLSKSEKVKLYTWIHNPK